MSAFKDWADKNRHVIDDLKRRCEAEAVKLKLIDAKLAEHMQRLAGLRNGAQHGVLQPTPAAEQCELKRQHEAEANAWHLQQRAGVLDPMACPRERASPRPSARYNTCGARTRAGHACNRKTLPGERCRNHGGCSTGPTTPEGKLRIAAAQRLRWARWRAEHGQAGAPA